MRKIRVIIVSVILMVLYLTLIILAQTRPNNEQLVYGFLILISVYPSAFLLIWLSNFK